MKAEEWISTLSYFVSAFSWGNIFLTIAFGFAIYLLYRMNKREARFDIADLFIDQQTQKASGSQIIVLSMAVLSAWVVVTLTEKDKPVETLLLGVLGIFVAGKAINAIWGKPEQDSSTKTTVEEVKVTPPATLPDVPSPPGSGTIPPSKYEG